MQTIAPDVDAAKPAPKGKAKPKPKGKATGKAKGKAKAKSAPKAEAPAAPAKGKGKGPNYTIVPIDHVELDLALREGKSVYLDLHGTAVKLWRRTCENISCLSSWDAVDSWVPRRCVRSSHLDKGTPGFLRTPRGGERVNPLANSPPGGGHAKACESWVP